MATAQTNSLYDPEGFLIERQGNQIGSNGNGILTVLGGAGMGARSPNADPNRVKKSGGDPMRAPYQSPLGLDYYEPMTGEKFNFDKYMVKGDKGYYNALAIMGNHPEGVNDLLVNPDKVVQYAKDDPTAQTALKNIIGGFRSQIFPVVQNGGEPVTSYLTKGGSNFRPAGDTSPDKVMGTGKSAVELTQAHDSILNIIRGTDISAKQDMPNLTTMADIQSGQAAKMMDIRSRKQVGKPAGYGAPVFSLLSGAAPTDNLLGA